MTKRISMLVMCTILLSSCGKMEVLLQAVKNRDNGIEKIEIYNNNQYSVFFNDSIINKGNAVLDKEKLLLSTAPKDISHSLVQSKEYEISGKELCPLIFDTKVDTPKYELELPRKIISKNDCYSITINRLLQE